MLPALVASWKASGRASEGPPSQAASVGHGKVTLQASEPPPAKREPCRLRAGIRIDRPYESGTSSAVDSGPPLRLTFPELTA